jgi:hypothetical protein
VPAIALATWYNDYRFAFSHFGRSEELSNQDRVGDLKAPTKSRSKRRSRIGAHRYRGQLPGPVTPTEKWKRPNALKHGLFSINPVIPGEDPREFEVLHSALIDEWTPCDITEEDLVFSIADAMWRKLRSQKFTRAKVIASSFDPRHPAFDETRGLITFIELMRHVPEMTFEKSAENYLRMDKVNHLRQKFPRSNYQSTSKWAEAVIEEVQSFLPPPTPNFDTLGLSKGVRNSAELMRESMDDFQLFFSAIHASEFLEHDLNQRERLDSRIARLIKELIQIKA